MFEFVYWHWWILAAILIIIETLLPGHIFLWIGISAALVGLLKLLFVGMHIEIQLLLFAIFSVASVWGWKQYCKLHPKQEVAPSLNEPGNRHIGKIIVLETPIVQHHGQVRINDVLWKVVGDDRPTGTKVKVVKLENTNTLRVEILPL